MSQSAVPFETSPEEMMKPIADMQSLMVEMAMSSPASRMMSPLMAHPAGATAAATAMTFGAASQMMGLFFGSMQGALDATRRMGWPVAALDVEAGFKPLDMEWTKAAGRAALEASTDAAAKARPVIEKTARETVADVRKNVEALTTGARKTAAATVEAVKPVAHKTGAVTATTKTVAAPAAEPVAATVRKAAASVKPAPAAAMTPPARAEKPESPDDLKLIAGVGPKLQDVLNKLGVWSYAQIADWTEAEIAWVDDYLQFKGRIARDGWIDQAKALLKK